MYTEKVQVDMPPILLSGHDCGPRDTKLFDCKTETKIKSGDVLVFHTEDPVNLPLPSIDLLNMQWLLNRLLAMSGAADAPELDEEEAEDEDTGEEGVVEVVEEKEIQSPILEISQIGENRPCATAAYTSPRVKNGMLGRLSASLTGGGDSYTR
jgi:hypothetical protein